MPFNVIKFFNFRYLVDMQPTIALSTVYWVIGICLVFVIAGGVLFFFEKKKTTEHIVAKLLMRYRHWAWTAAGLGLLYAWLRYEQAYFVSARFWLPLIAIIMAIWIGFIIRYQLTVVPEALKTLAQKRQLSKYIPTRKK